MGEKKFKVGDRVKCIRNTWSTVPILNECGTVCEIRTCDVGINFDKDVNGHRCSGHCENGHGWYLLPNEIELVTPEFKVGDRVVGIGRFDSRDIDGKLGTVVKITNDGIKDIGVEFDEHIDGHSAGGKAKDGHGWFVESYALKLVDTPTWKVLIMSDGDKTTGRLYENGKVVKSVETKKHPDDEYSIEAACEVIMERMFPKTPTIVKQDKYEVGDKVKIVDKWNKDTNETMFGDMDKYLGTVMTIRSIDSDGDYRMEDDKYECGGWYWNKHCIEGKVVESKVEEPPKPTYYNGKVVCTKGAFGLTTTGKIYEFVDGKLTYDNGDKSNGYCKDFKDVCKSFIAKFIEVVE